MNEFQIGLVLSGGATRGAYTAGVLDYLLEALAEWEKAQEDGNAKSPPWKVRIRNMVSSSAGALASVLTAASLTGYHKPVARDLKVDDPLPTRNLLYRGWVSEFKVERLLDCSDIPSMEEMEQGKTDIRSLLNSSFLMEIARDVCRNQRVDQPIPRWCRDIQLYFTFLNLRGVPYSFDMDDSLDKSARAYTMLSHADSIGFSTSRTKKKTMYSLDLQEERTSPKWRNLFETATASAAIPVVFPSVLVSKPLRHYKESNRHGNVEPSWPVGMPNKYTFNAADGGIIDNEPVGICRNALVKSVRKGAMESSAESSWGAILLVDTDSNKKGLITSNADVKPLPIWENVIRALDSVKEEARLKDEELLKARDNNDFSQCIISPLHPHRSPEQIQLATEVFYKFGGALDKRIRHHDFMLGRKNCQDFLMNNFKINVQKAVSNPIFQGIEEYANGSDYVHIIPLFGTASEECVSPQWPSFSQEEKTEIENRLYERLLQRVELLLYGFVKKAGIFHEHSSWWRIWPKIWTKAVTEIIGLVSRYISRQITKILRKAFENF